MPVKTNKNIATTILFAGGVAGTLDIVTACTDYFLSTGKGPSGVLRYVASGLFGNRAFTGSSNMLAAGLLIHYLIAFFFTCFFFWLYPRFRLINRSQLLIAVLYGIFVWIVMNLIIVRLSATAQTPLRAMQPFKIIKSMLILVCMIGMPLSLIAHRYFKQVKPITIQHPENE